MRISVRVDDPDYSEDAWKARVWFNGEMLTHCETADEDHGLVWVLKLDDVGKPIWDRNARRFLRTCLRGRVLIELGGLHVRAN